MKEVLKHLYNNSIISENTRTIAIFTIIIIGTRYIVYNLYLDWLDLELDSFGQILAERKIVDTSFHTSCVYIQIEPNKPLFLLCLGEIVKILPIDKRILLAFQPTVIITKLHLL